MPLATTIIENISSEDGSQWTYLLTRGLGNWHEICRFDNEGHRVSLYSQDNGKIFEVSIGLEILNAELSFESARKLLTERGHIPPTCETIMRRLSCETETVFYASKLDAPIKVSKIGRYDWPEFLHHCS